MLHLPEGKLQREKYRGKITEGKLQRENYRGKITEWKSVKKQAPGEGVWQIKLIVVNEAS